MTITTIVLSSQAPFSPVSVHGPSTEKVLARTSAQIVRPRKGVGHEKVTSSSIIYTGVVAPPTLEKHANNLQIFISKLAVCQRVVIHQAHKSANYVSFPGKHSALYG